MLSKRCRDDVGMMSVEDEHTPREIEKWRKEGKSDHEQFMPKTAPAGFFGSPYDLHMMSKCRCDVEIMSR